MRHSVFGRKLSRSKNERRRLLQGLARDLVIHSSIRTTLAKAKAVQSYVEKLVTLAKNDSRASRQQVKKILAQKNIEKMLIDDAKTRFAGRTSGFTRIVKLGKRLGDATEEVFLQFVDGRVQTSVITPEKKVVKTKPVKKTIKK